MQTPDFNRIGANFEHVYEPAEDTFVLLDALEADLEEIRCQDPVVVVEIGAGSGCVITALRLALSPNRFFLATDINPEALATTRKCCEANGAAPIELVQSDLFSALRLNGLVDLMVFNPPYVPTDSVPKMASLESAWAGGKSGMEVTDRFLRDLPRLLSPVGRCYLIAIEQNRPDEIVDRLKADGMVADIAIRRKAGMEVLSVIRIQRSNSSESR